MSYRQGKAVRDEIENHRCTLINTVYLTIGVYIHIISQYVHDMHVCRHRSIVHIPNELLPIRHNVRNVLLKQELQSIPKGVMFEAMPSMRVILKLVLALLYLLALLTLFKSRSSHILQSNVEKEQSLRRLRLESACEATETKRQILPIDYEPVLVYPEKHVYWCPVFKSSTTTWLRFMFDTTSSLSQESVQT